MTTILVVLLVALSICLVLIWDSLGKQIRRVDGRFDEFEHYVYKSLYPMVISILNKKINEVGEQESVVIPSAGRAILIKHLDELRKDFEAFKKSTDALLGKNDIIQKELTRLSARSEAVDSILSKDLQDQLDINKYINSRIHELRKEVEFIKKTRAIAKAPKSESKKSVNKSVKSAIPAKEVVESVVTAKSVVESVKKKR